MTEIIDYILHFLLGETVSADIKMSVGYTDKQEEFSQYKLVIVLSQFFGDTCYGNEKSLPQLPLDNWEGTPLLFGIPKTEQLGDTLVLHADIIASTYFLISRYEETVNLSRDNHGRFSGKESLPFKAGFLHRPIVDEYGKSLRKLLRNIGFDISEPPATLRKIYLTHDVDKLLHYRNFRSVAGAMLRLREIKTALKTYFGGIEHDPWYTFSWVFGLNKSLQEKLGNDVCQTIAFIKSGGGKQPEDQPISNIFSKDFQAFFKLCRTENVTLGLHPSYEAGEKSELIQQEKQLLEKALGAKIHYSRHHFLRSREPRDMQTLIDAGITDDFTMGYADVAGFRLGTSRPVCWINPETKQLTSLILHPLTVMDSTLSDERYMALHENAACDYCLQLIEETKRHNGDLTLLWHNTSVEKGVSYQRGLYERLIEYLKK